MQLASLLRNRILDGTFAVGTQLPTEGDLAADHALSRGTVLGALMALETEGLLLRKPGKGTYVSLPPTLQQDVGVLDSLYNTMARAGLSPIIEIVDFRFVTPVRKISQKLELSADEPEALLITRKYSPRGQDAIALAFTHIPQRFGRYFSRGDIERYQIYELLQARCGITLGHGRRTITARSADTYVAHILGIRVSDAVLVAELRTFSTEGVPVQVTEYSFRSDRFAFAVDVPWLGSMEFPPLVWAGEVSGS
jgi:GntR family transcriptional regulator